MKNKYLGMEWGGLWPNLMVGIALEPHTLTQEE